MTAFSRGRADYFAMGDHNAICYECGRKRKASGMKRHWTGYWVCPEHWEPRQAQDFVRNVVDNQTPPWTQPPADTFRYTCTGNGMTGIAGYGTADCARPDYVSPLLDPSLTP
jgi:elongation factor P hydroxylase